MKMKSGIVFAAAFLVFLTIEPVMVSAETFEEYRERTRREQEEQRRRREDQQNNQNNDDDDKGDFWGACFGNCLGAMLQGMCEAAATDSGDEQSGSSTGNTYDTYDDQGAGESTRMFVEVNAEVPFLFGDEDMIVGACAQVNITFSFFHLNAYYGKLFNDGGEDPGSFALHAGFAIPTDRFMFALFGGIYSQPYVEYIGFSFGANMRAYLSDKFIWSLDAFCSIDGSLYFIIASTGVNYKVDPLVIGAGVNLFNFNDFILFGPSVKVGLWF
ncbi:MAG: hypothetical protein EHM28_11490 [Spirochaetaceae bacterium]|nr:MAG: hypothetical protein EHM28_11490 [Spirochaetaceae bacterium]